MKARTNFVAKQVSAFLSAGDKILDVGAGSGWIAERIKERKNTEVMLLDVVDFNQTDLPLQLYDGNTMPFKDNSFDATLLIFMLHHCSNPLAVLKEATRVSKNRIIVIEDTFLSWFDKAALCINDIAANLPSFLIEPMNMPLNFKKTAEWERVFQNLSLKVVHQKRIQSFPIQKTLFVLEK